MSCHKRVNNSIKFFIKVQKLAKKKSIRLGSFVGMGCMGAAFSYGKNKISKITTDPNEAAYCNYILKNKLKTTPQIYAVYKVSKIWMIIQEKLSELDSKKDATIINIFKDNRKTRALQRLITNAKIKTTAQFFKHYRLPKNKVLRTLAEKILAVRGYTYPDIKHSNVLKKRKQYYFIDCKLNDKALVLNDWLESIPKWH